MPQKPETINIEYKLTPDEKAQLSTEIMDMLADMEDLEQEKKDSNATFNAKINMLKENINAQAQIHRQGWEPRTVECDVVMDYKGHKVVYLYAGTDNEAATRKMTPDEFQMPLADMK